ncbi:hypothetical protein [Streptomyces sp. NPDC060010]
MALRMFTPEASTAVLVAAATRWTSAIVVARTSRGVPKMSE